MAPLLLSFLVMLAIKVESRDTSFEINAFTNNSLRLTYQRDAVVPPDTTYVRLVSAAPDSPYSSVGRVLYTQPVQMWDLKEQASFETTITLKVTPLNASSLCYYGMTFFIVPVNSTTKTTGGDGDDLGIYYDQRNPGFPYFAVEFDFAINSYYDPEYPHMGININSKTSQNHTKLELSKFAGQLVSARITYDAPTRKIKAVARYGSTTAVARFVYNLRGLLPQEVQVGLSASTFYRTRFAAYFDVYTWNFNSFMGPDTNIDHDTYIK